jgi:excisionase family DNA binding protein
LLEPVAAVGPAQKMIMKPDPASQHWTILYADDEQNSLKYFTRVFDHEFNVLTAGNAAGAYRLLAQHKDEIAVLIAGQQLPDESGLHFLQRASTLHPQALRILTASHSDTNLIVDALKSSGIYAFVTKPWDIPELETILKRACERYTQQREHKGAAASALTGPQASRYGPETGPLLTVDELARYLNVDKFTVYRLISQDKLPAFKVGNQWRFKQELIDEWLQGQLNTRT